MSNTLKISIILLLMTLNFADRVIHLTGPLRVGKDSFIDTVCKSKQAKPVNSLYSGTTEIEVYSCFVNGEQWTIYNTPGFFNNLLTFDDEEVQRNLTDFFVNRTKSLNGGEAKIDTIINFENLVVNRVEIPLVLQRIQEIFGESSLQSSIILGNFASTAMRADKFKYTQKKDELKFISQYKLIPYVEFETIDDRHPMSEEQYKAQFESLIKAMDQTQPFYLKDIQMTFAEIYLIAERILNQTPKIQSKECTTEDREVTQEAMHCWVSCSFWRCTDKCEKYVKTSIEPFETCITIETDHIIEEFFDQAKKEWREDLKSKWRKEDL